jgi:uncharacterized membrane protein
MIALYILAGTNHFLHPQVYKAIMPSWLLWHDQLVFISGVCEIVFALLLLFKSTRWFGAWAIIYLLVAVFPANIQAALNYYQKGHLLFWLSILRLPLQVLLIGWAYSFTKKGIR